MDDSRVSAFMTNILTPRRFRRDVEKNEIWNEYSFPMFRRRQAAEFISNVPFRCCKTTFTNTGAIFLNESSKLGVNEQASFISYLEKRMMTEYFETIRITFSELYDDQDFVERIMGEVQQMAQHPSAAAVQLGEAVAASEANLTRQLEAQRVENERVIASITSGASTARRDARERYRLHLDELKKDYINQLQDCSYKLQDFNEELLDMDKLVAKEKGLRKEAERALKEEKLVNSAASNDVKRLKLDMEKERTKADEERLKCKRAEQTRGHLERARDLLQKQISSLKESLTLERRELQKQFKQSQLDLQQAKTEKLAKDTAANLEATNQRLTDKFTVTKSSLVRNYNAAMMKLKEDEGKMTARLQNRIACAKKDLEERTVQIEKKAKKEKDEQEDIIRELRVQLFDGKKSAQALGNHWRAQLEETLTLAEEDDNSTLAETAMVLHIEPGFDVFADEKVQVGKILKQMDAFWEIVSVDVNTEHGGFMASELLVNAFLYKSKMASDDGEMLALTLAKKDSKRCMAALSKNEHFANNYITLKSPAGTFVTFSGIVWLLNHFKELKICAELVASITSHGTCPSPAFLRACMTRMVSDVDHRLYGNVLSIMSEDGQQKLMKDITEWRNRFRLCTEDLQQVGGVRQCGAKVMYMKTTCSYHNRKKLH
jgi:hypothetical protein